jgi:TonB family protein
MSPDIDRNELERHARQELDVAESWLRADVSERRRIGIALAAAIIVHAVVLVARMPNWIDPIRVDAPREQAMQVQFLKPPSAPPKVEKKVEPKPKKVPRPDPTPDEPEPVEEPEPQPAKPAPAAAPMAQQTGPVRVMPGQGPGLIKKVEPEYPPLARAARIEGTVLVDAIIRKDGTVTDVTVIKSSNTLFNQSTIDAVRQWRFTPWQHDVVLTVTVTFVLR